MEKIKTSSYKQILARTAIETGQSRPVIGRIVNLFLGGVQQKLLNGEEVKFRGFGALHIELCNIGQSKNRPSGLNGVVFKTKFAPSRTFKKLIGRNRYKIAEKIQPELDKMLLYRSDNGLKIELESIINLRECLLCESKEYLDNTENLISEADRVVGKINQGEITEESDREIEVLEAHLEAGYAACGYYEEDPMLKRILDEDYFLMKRQEDVNVELDKAPELKRLLADDINDLSKAMAKWKSLMREIEIQRDILSHKSNDFHSKIIKLPWKDVSKKKVQVQKIRLAGRKYSPEYFSLN